ncbi:MAG TPA: hypothetical protein VHS34_02845 [Terriglobales bacterium]|jgi:hypothetical protein|nr:hypothetical protein [Terriglobales bacterium]
MAETPRPLHQLMYGLIYPAVLGTGIVLIGVRAAHQHGFLAAVTDPSVLLGVMACTFFAASFDSAFYWPADSPNAAYSRSAFWLDVGEVIVMFVCFHFLRLFEDPKALEPANLWPVYLALGLGVASQYGWRKVVGLKWEQKWALRLAISVLLFAGIYLAHFDWFNICAAVAMIGFVIIYVLTDPRYKTKEMQQIPAAPAASADTAKGASLGKK